MNKIIAIDGMSCSHCQKAVEDALNSIEGVKAAVDLKRKCAVITLRSGIEDAVLTSAIVEAGYEVVSVTEE